MIAPARRAAFEALLAVTERKTDLAAAMARARRHLPDERDRALATEIATGTLRWMGALDHVIAHYARRPVSRLDAAVRDVLRMSAYQLTHLERVPAPAVVDDAVELTRRAGKRSAAGLVNAVLRTIARERARLPLPAAPAPPGPPTLDAALDYLSITLSHPRWLVARWFDRLGFDATLAWTRFNNTPAPLVLRANVLKTTVAALRAELGAMGIEAEPTRYAPHGLIVRRGNPLLTPLATAGHFVVQDEASQLVARFAAARPGERVLDLCAAPGNKTLALAGDLEDAGVIVAADLRARRVDLLRRTIAAGGARGVQIVRLDAQRPLPFRVPFDIVLVDAPCSGLGTIRRDPDIRWRRTAADLSTLADAQVRMLDQAAAVVAAGGRLIYATCSSEPEENDDVVRGFLEAHHEFQLVDPRDRAGWSALGLDEVVDERGCLRTLPWAHGLEAFFAGMLVRAKDL